MFCFLLSVRFMLILASNQPDQFDWAINDRLDDLIAFSIPGEDERLRMLKQYFAQVQCTWMCYVSYNGRSLLVQFCWLN